MPPPRDPETPAPSDAPARPDEPVPPGPNAPEALLPLTPQVYHVLLALGDATLHGYAIIQAFEALTDGRETLLPGSLYATLDRMTRDGLLERAPAPPGESSGGPRRRYYRVTAFGRAVGRAESLRMARLLDVARSRDLAPGELR